MLHEPIKDVKGKGWCGPTAISSITQTPISKIQKMVRRIRADRERKLYGHIVMGGRAENILGHKMPVRGMYPVELIETMRRLKWKATENKKSSGTLAQFMDDYGHTGPFVVEVTNHFVAISHGMICDTHSKIPVPFADYKRKRAMVKRFTRFTR